MLIKIIAGTFGHRVGSRVVAVKAGDNPTEVAEEGHEGVEFPAFDESMTRKELEGVALGVGISREAIKDAKKKAELVALIQEAYEEYQLAGDMPTFDPAEAML